jgi:uncharacterized protein YeeX (DUF496 family)
MSKNIQNQIQDNRFLPKVQDVFYTFSCDEQSKYDSLLAREVELSKELDRLNDELKTRGSSKANTKAWNAALEELMEVSKERRRV